MERFEFMLYTVGKNPIKNLIARVVDGNALNKNVTLHQSNVFQQIIPIGNIMPKHYMPIVGSYMTQDTTKMVSLNIFFNSDGLDYNEQLRYRLINSQWREAILVISDRGVIIYKKIDSQWPRKNDDEVWQQPSNTSATKKNR